MDKKSKRRIKRGVNFNDEMGKGKYGWSEAASERCNFPNPFKKLRKYTNG